MRYNSLRPILKIIVGWVVRTIRWGVSLLEIIALDVADARNAQDGGADRIELVSDMSRSGLTPDVSTFEAVRDAVGLPIRTMLRQCDGFAAGDLDRLRRDASALRAAGADEFVLGFLDSHGAVDVPAVRAVLDVIEGCAWTFHRAIDHTADRMAAWQAIDALPGLDFVLTSGSPVGVAEGVDVLVADAAAGHGARVLAGGGLQEQQFAPLLAGGVDAFHTGSAVRPGGRWDVPVDATLVRQWRDGLPPARDGRT
jgi:copper homeostasis protein